MSISVIIAGAAGRMGIEIARAALSVPAIKLKGGLEPAGHASIGFDMGVAATGVACGATIVGCDQMAAFDNTVVIDFTVPSATVELIARVEKSSGAAMVIGTTGCSAEQIEQIKSASKRIPVVFSPNMSLGVNLLFHLTGIVAARLKDRFDIEIIEAHHHHKKDAPSGTAVRIAQVAAEAIGSSYEKAVCTGRDGIVGERPAGQIGVHAVRGGDIVGDHTVLFAGPGERIELRHVAHSRATFAQGAVAAAQWVADKEPGLYSMADVLGL